MEVHFVQRLKLLLSQKELSAAAFAEAISVPRSSISHLLSGRNRPSLDFVMKVVQRFPEVDLYWLLFGNEAKAMKSPTPTSNSEAPAKKEIPTKNKPQPVLAMDTKDIVKIVWFYKDGSFDAFSPNQ
ncbi:helix-turn-helix transcriptional regulator [Flagellimonas sp. DF-77]|uniref:helix-turn-helix transcriptional regulator n=1 Tax=Flagellimonas algarum TaxID=3230298 RepID=UPI003396381D